MFASKNNLCYNNIAKKEPHPLTKLSIGEYLWR